MELNTVVVGASAYTLSSDNKWIKRSRALESPKPQTLSAHSPFFDFCSSCYCCELHTSDVETDDETEKDDETDRP